MEFLEKKGFRFLIHFVSVIIIVIGFWLLAIEGPFGLEIDVNSIMFGALSTIGYIFFFIAFDLLGDIENCWGSVFGTILAVLGGIITVLGMLMSYFTFFNCDFSNPNPWTFSLAGLWLNAGLVSFFLQLGVKTGTTDKTLSAFIPLMTVAGAYLFSVIWIYLGILFQHISGLNGLVTFLSGVGNAAVAIFLIIMLFVKKKEEKTSTINYREYYKSSTTTSKNSNTKDTKPNIPDWRMESLIKENIIKKITGRRGSYNRVQMEYWSPGDPSVWVRYSSCCVNIDGDIKCITSSKLDESELSDDIEALKEKLEENIKSDAKWAIYDIVKEYCEDESIQRDYDKWDIKVEIKRVSIRKIGL